MDEQHNTLVRQLSSQIKTFYKHRKPFKIYHGSTNSTRVLEFDQKAMIDTSRLNRVLSVDAKRRTALVEANVPMDQLVQATLQHELIPPVVMEFPGITVAGGLQGGAGESSSFKWGGFNQILNWFEVVLANGEIVRASPQKNADLFYGSAGAYGTLGVVTLAEVQLIEAKPLVELELRVVHSLDEANKALLAAAAEQPDFVDGILFAHDLGVIIVGQMKDTSAASRLQVSRPWDDWFYLQIERAAHAGMPQRVAMSLKDYLFRYDRGAFWMGKYAFERFGQPFNRVMRRLLDRVMHTRPMYEALQASGVSQEFLIQDLALPPENAVAFMEWTDKQLGIYPLWLCPLKINDPGGKSPLLSRPLKNGLAVNIGVWGPVSRDLDAVVQANRQLEAKLTSLGGRKWLYAYAYYTEQEFWRLYDRKWYDALRRKYHAETLPTIYDKICRTNKIKITAKRGILTALLGRRGVRIQK